MRIAIGVVLWSIVLVMAYRTVPRVLPHSIRLARLGIGCASLMIPAGLEMLVNGRPGWSSAQGTFSTIIDVIGGGSRLRGNRIYSRRLTIISTLVHGRRHECQRGTQECVRYGR